MAIKVEIQDGEPIEQALRRLQTKVRAESGRSWCKRRFGYYEKPSALKRKAKKMKALSIQSGGSLWLKIDLRAQFSRSGGTATGR